MLEQKKGSGPCSQAEFGDFTPETRARFCSVLGLYNSRSLESVKSTKQEGQLSWAGLWNEGVISNQNLIPTAPGNGQHEAKAGLQHLGYRILPRLLKLGIV